MNIGWQDCEYGAPEVDPKRPYGNSSVEEDIAEILGWKVGEDGLTEKQSEKASGLHSQMETVLQIGVSTLKFEVGTYKLKDDYSTDWKKV